MQSLLLQLRGHVRCRPVHEFRLVLARWSRRAAAAALQRFAAGLDEAGRVELRLLENRRVINDGRKSTQFRTCEYVVIEWKHIMIIYDHRIIYYVLHAFCSRLQGPWTTSGVFDVDLYHQWE